MRNAITICLAALLSVSATVPATADEPYPWDLETGREFAILGTATASLVAGGLIQASHRPLTTEELEALDRADVWAFDRGATMRWSPGASRASDYFAMGTLVAPLGLMIAEPGSDQAATLGLIYGETVFLNMGLTALFKGLVARPRPFLFNDDPRIPAELKASAKSRHSFPSGHTSGAFASMVFLAGSYAKLYPDSGARGWVWGGCLAAAGTTGYLRYRAGRHYPTDILAGAVLGAVVGWLVPYLHEVDPAAEGRPPAKMQFGWGFAF